MESFLKDRKYFLNPVSIVIMMFLFTLISITGERAEYMAMLGLSFLVILFIDRRKAVKIIPGYIIFYILVYAVNQNVRLTHWGGAMFTMAVMILKLAPILILVGAITSFSSSELMTAFRKAGIPQNITVAIAVFFRFYPEFKHRLKEIGEGAKVRGYGISVIHPVRTFEVFIVPMLFKGLAVSDTLTCSILTKGIEYPCKKTSYRPISYRWTDFFLIVLSIAVAGVSIWKKIKM